VTPTRQNSLCIDLIRTIKGRILLGVVQLDKTTGRLILSTRRRNLAERLESGIYSAYVNVGRCVHQRLCRRISYKKGPRVVERKSSRGRNDAKLHLRKMLSAVHVIGFICKKAIAIIAEIPQFDNARQCISVLGVIAKRSRVHFQLQYIPPQIA